MLRHPATVEPVSPMPSSYTAGWGTVSEGSDSAAPSSGTWPSANTGLWIPVYVPTVCVAKRMWWANGSAVSSTYLVEAGIYAGDKGKPVLKMGTTGGIPQGTASQVQFAEFGTSTAVLATLAGSSGADGVVDSPSSMTFFVLPDTMYFAAVTIRATAASHASTMSSIATVGGGLTFTERAVATWSWDGTYDAKTFFYTAVATSEVTADVRITLTTAADHTVVAVIGAVSNVDTTTDHGVVQTATNLGNSATASATLSSFASAGNGALGVVGDYIPTPSVGTGFSSVASTGSSNLFNFVEHKPVEDTSVDAGIGAGGYWGIIGVELARKAPTLVLTPRLYWVYGNCASGSATFMRSTGSANFDELFGFVQSTVGPGKSPLVAAPAERSSAYMYALGFDTRGV